MPDGLKGGVEPFNMADLQSEIIFFGNFDQLIRLAGCGGDGFLDEGVNAVFEKEFGHLMMGLCRNADIHRVNPAG